MGIIIKNNVQYGGGGASPGGVALEALNDVAISNKQPDDSLVWDEDLGKWVNKNVSTKFALLPVSNVTATPTDSTVALSWTNPGNVLVGGTIVAEFYKTKIIRKEGSAPTDITDGTEVYDSNGTSFTDEDLTESTTYYYAFYAYTDKEVYSEATVESVTTQGQGHLLPDAYQQVEYIESHGTEYIDTLYRVTSNNVKAEFKFSAQTTTNWRIYGAQSSGKFSGMPYGLGYTTNNVIAGACGNSSTTLQSKNISFSANDVHTMNFSANNGSATLMLDGTVYTDTYSGELYKSNTIYVFGVNIDNAPSIGDSHNKIYYFKLFDNGTLVRDYYPCYRKSDSKPGLYDVVNDVFYTNQGTGEFTCGVSVDALPEGYTQVEYIQSTGTQYIDTNLMADENQFHECRFALGEIPTGNIATVILGANKNLHQNTVIAHGNGRYYMSVGNIERYTSVTHDLNIHTTKYSEYSSDGMFLDNAKLATAGSTSCTAGESDTFYIFANHASGSALSLSKIKLYTLRFWNGNGITRDFIPCKNASNVVGLYDCVNGVFYDNDGTGDFIAGPPIVPTPTETITLTLEGAKEDNIIIKDAHGDTVGSCIFASGATSGTVTLDIAEDWPYTFESTVAKDATTGTSNYTKTVNLNKTTALVKVMPDGAVYWYGNECVTLTGGWNTDYMIDSSVEVIKDLDMPQKLTNYLETDAKYQLGRGSGLSFFATTNLISFNGYSKISMKAQGIALGTGADRNYIILYSCTQKIWTSGLREPRIDISYNSLDNSIMSENLNGATDSVYFMLGAPGTRKGRCYAIWLE